MAAEIHVELLTNSNDADDPTGPLVATGAPITWSYEVSNPGDEPLTNVSLVDDNGTGFDPAPMSLSRFIDAPDRVDTVHDAKRGLLYISTSPDDGNGQILRYDLASRAFLTPFALGGKLGGIDLSPNQDTLVVADRSYDGGAGENWVHVIDLTNGASRKIEFPLQSLEGGTYTVAFTDDQTVLVTSTFRGSGWVPLRKVDLQTDTFVSLRSVRQNTMLTAGADRSVVAYAEANISSGAFGGYDVGSESFASWETGWFAFEIGVSRDGSQYAVPSYSGTFIYDANFNSLGKIGHYADESPIGVVYSPVADVVYFAWYDWDDQHAAIDVYDTNSLERIATIDAASRFGWTGNWAFGEGRLKISRDGESLFATVDDGVMMYGQDDFQPTRTGGDGNSNGLLDPGETWLYEVNGLAGVGQYSRTGRVTAEDSSSQVVSDEDTSHYFGVRSEIRIELATNGEDADTPTGPSVANGGNIDWTVEVTNPGNMPLSGIAVTDDNGTPNFLGGDRNNDQLLDPGETWRYEASGVATLGQQSNSASVTGTDVLSGTVTDNDSSHYVGVASGIRIELATNGEDADTPTGPTVSVGDPVEWVYEVTNTGLGPLHTVEVVDDNGTPGDPSDDPALVGGDNNSNGLLDVGETWWYEASAVAQLGPFSRTAHVTAKDATDQSVSDDDPSHYLGVDAGIQIEFSTNGQDADDAPGPLIADGGTVTRTYEITNTGSIPLSNVVVTDDGGTGFEPTPMSTSTFLEVPGRIDMVHDAKRGLLYITTSPGDGNGEVLRYDLASGTYLAPFALGGELNGIDLSPNQMTLVVADAHYDSQNHINWIHVIDLRDGTSRQIELPGANGGTFTAAFTDNNTVLVTSMYSGSGSATLWEVDLQTDTYRDFEDPHHPGQVLDVQQNTMLAPSADLSVVAMAENNISNAPFWQFHVADDSFTGSQITSYAFEIGVSRDGTQVAVPSYHGTFVYNVEGSTYTLVDTIGLYADEAPIGVVYSPVEDLMYLAWWDRWFDDPQHASIDVYDTNTLTKIATIDPTPRYEWNGGFAFHQGRLRISRDGRLLFATVGNKYSDGPFGVMIYGTDDVLPDFRGGDADQDGLLDPGEVWRYETRGLATTGQHANVARVTASAAMGHQVSDEDLSHYQGVMDAPPLVVEQVSLTASGFDVRFNRPPDQDTLNLVNVTAEGQGLADVTMVGDVTGAVDGMLAFDWHGQSMRFARTGGRLEPDTYTITLRSDIVGFRDLDGEPLDGDYDGDPGGDYSIRLTVEPDSVRIVSIPDFTRGPRQHVAVPTTAPGVPVTISDGAGVDRVEFAFHHDPALLRVTGFSLSDALPSDWTGAVSFDSPGQMRVSIYGETELASGAIVLGHITGVIPADAPYGAATLLPLDDVQLDGGNIAARADSAVQIIAFFGDSTGNGTYSGLDAAYIARVAVGLDDGFAAFPLSDPHIMGDVTGNGAFTGLDAQKVARAVVGLPQEFIPILPENLPVIEPNGPDPLVSIGTATDLRAGAEVTLPVSVDDDAAGILSIDDLTVVYDTSILDVYIEDVAAGSLLQNGGFAPAANVDDAIGQIRLTAFGLNPMPHGTGDLFNITFHVRPDAPSGMTALRFTGGTLNEGRLVMTNVDGWIEIAAPQPALPVVEDPDPPTASQPANLGLVVDDLGALPTIVSSALRAGNAALASTPIRPAPNSDALVAFVGQPRGRQPHDDAISGLTSRGFDAPARHLYWDTMGADFDGPSDLESLSGPSELEVSVVDAAFRE